eukprot:CAMPEP_0116874732 /NCGR_PEP_ID=MMETSP0463-20121206/6285_1 /TAXON_ID=181622 /ORGANISM="Strombidinopsis sp, Strain SopsisLIS2011" /LENGTH=46 /DNA_ID= /DNA_START= /DNA_END= /DNA_ORIENTATION=
MPVYSKSRTEKKPPVIPNNDLYKIVNEGIFETNEDGDTYDNQADMQ